MTDVVRLTLVSHAMTEAMAAGRFPNDESLSELGRRQVARGAATHTYRELAGPEQRTRQTAQLLGLHAAAEPRLADLDYGDWRGQPMDCVDPDSLRVWLTDPDAAPHGGESIVALVERVSGWLNSLSDNAIRTTAVTHPAVIRAALLVILDAPPKSFWRFDVAPVSRTVLHHKGESWTLRL